MRPAAHLAHVAATLGRLPGDLSLDVIEPADPLQRGPRQRRAGGLPEVVEGAPQVRPAGRLANPRYGIRRRRLVELGESPIGVGLQDAGEPAEVALRVFGFAVGGEGVGGCRRIRATPRPVVADIDPQPAFLDRSRLAPGLTHRRIKHPDGRIVGMQAIAAHHVGPDPIDQRPEHGDRLAAPVDQRRTRNVGALSRQDLALAI